MCVLMISNLGKVRFSWKDSYLPLQRVTNKQQNTFKVNFIEFDKKINKGFD